MGWGHAARRAHKDFFVCPTVSPRARGERKRANAAEATQHDRENNYTEQIVPETPKLVADGAPRTERNRPERLATDSCEPAQRI